VEEAVGAEAEGVADVDVEEAVDAEDVVDAEEVRLESFLFSSSGHNLALTSCGL
jgi:hypothetical protein